MPPPSVDTSFLDAISIASAIAFVNSLFLSIFRISFNSSFSIFSSFVPNARLTKLLFSSSLLWLVSCVSVRWDASWSSPFRLNIEKNPSFWGSPVRNAVICFCNSSCSCGLSGCTEVSRSFMLSLPLVSTSNTNLSSTGSASRISLRVSGFSSHLSI